MTKVRCPKCGEKNDAQNKDCLYCGGTLGAIKKKLSKQSKPIRFLRNNMVFAIAILVGMLLFGLAVAAKNGGFNFISKTPSSIQNQNESKPADTGTKIIPNSNETTDPTPNTQQTRTTDPNPNTQQTKTTPAPTNNVKPYVPGVCSSASIPYETKTVYDPNLADGQTRTTGGFNGTVYSCTPDSAGYVVKGFTSPATDKIITVGTKRSNHNMCIAGYLATYPGTPGYLVEQWCYTHGDPY